MDLSRTKITMFITINDVCAATGLSRSNVYRYFEDVEPNRIIQPPQGRPVKLYDVFNAIVTVRSRRREKMTGEMVCAVLGYAQARGGSGVSGPVAPTDAESLVAAMLSGEAERFRVFENRFQKSFENVFFGRSHRISTRDLRMKALGVPEVLRFIFGNEPFPVDFRFDEFVGNFAAQNATADEIIKLNGVIEERA